MQILDVIQGSPEWLSLRSRHLCASDAPVMMGAKGNRAELVRAYAIGSEKEFSEWVQKNILDRGHEAEDLIRPHIEEMIGEDLYPVVGATRVDGLDMPLLASYDGLTFDQTRSMEHKLINRENVEIVDAGEVPDEHVWQLEHQALVAGSLREIIFVVSDGTAENKRHCLYRPDPERQKRLIAGWKQFIEDVRNYQHVEVREAPVGRAPEMLPALRVELRGMVLNSNLNEFREKALTVLNSINTDLKTDEDFANAEATAKWCAEVEKRLEAAKDAALRQTADVHTLLNAIDEIREEARKKRLLLDREVKSRKETIRASLVSAARNALEAHCRALDSAFGAGYGVQMPRLQVDFAAVIKGKRLLSSMRDALDTALAQAKIECNSIADKIRRNLKTLDEIAPDHGFLFPDLNDIAWKERSDFEAIVKARIADHQRQIEAQRAATEATEATEATKATEVPASGEEPEQMTGPACKLRPKVHRAIINALVGKAFISTPAAARIVDLVIAGEIPNLSIVE